MSLFDKLMGKKEKQETHGKYASSTTTNSKKMAYGFEYGHRIVFIEEHKYEPLSDYGIRLLASCLTWHPADAATGKPIRLAPLEHRMKDIPRCYVVQSILLECANPPLEAHKIEEGKKKLEQWKKLYLLTDEDIKDAREEIIKNLKLINGMDYICLDTLE